jgi:hypothetical protein
VGLTGKSRLSTELCGSVAKRERFEVKEKGMTSEVRGGGR